nr:MAG TPA_asm: hypothetical protein [Caudoviricetes sp.]DAP13644.1 MAG TPA: hypothetical protein [Caudoviricetes sp.]
MEPSVNATLVESLDCRRDWRHPVDVHNGVVVSKEWSKQVARTILEIVTRSEQEVVVALSITVRVGYHRLLCLADSCCFYEYRILRYNTECCGQSKLPYVCASLGCLLNTSNRNCCACAIESVRSYHDIVSNEWNVLIAITYNKESCVSSTGLLCTLVRLKNLNSCACVAIDARIILQEVTGVNLCRTLERVEQLTTSCRSTESILCGANQLDEYIADTADFATSLDEGTTWQEAATIHPFTVIRRNCSHNQ